MKRKYKNGIIVSTLILVAACGADFTQTTVKFKIEKNTTSPRTSSLEWTEVGTEVPAHVERLEAHAAPPMGSGQRLRLEFSFSKGNLVI